MRGSEGAWAAADEGWPGAATVMDGERDGGRLGGRLAGDDEDGRGSAAERDGAAGADGGAVQRDEAVAERAEGEMIQAVGGAGGVRLGRNGHLQPVAAERAGGDMDGRARGAGDGRGWRGGDRDGGSIAGVDVLAGPAEAEDADLDMVGAGRSPGRCSPGDRKDAGLAGREGDVLVVPLVDLVV